MADIIDYQIFGDDLQLVEIELDPNEGVRAEAGTMTYMEDGIQMETGTGGGVFKGLQRAFTGESFFITTFLIFLVVRIIPGDPIQAQFGERAVPPSLRDAYIERYHLDEPLPDRSSLVKIRQRLGLTTLKYQKLTDLVEAIGLPKEKLCTYCWDGCEPHD